MGNLALPFIRRRTSQPPANTQVSQAELPKGLVAAYNGADWLKKPDAAVSVANSGAAFKFQKGLAAVSTNDATTSYLEHAGAFSRLITFTLVAIYSVRTVPSTACRAISNFSSSAYGYAVAPNATNYRALFYSGVNQTLTGSAIVAGKLKIDVLTSSSGGTKYFENGVLSASSALQANAPTGNLRIGADNGGSANSGPIDVFGYLLYNRVLSAAEIADLSSNPWRIFLPSVQRVFVPLSAGGENNLAASGGDAAAGQANLAAQVALAAVGVSVANASAAPAVSVPLSATGLAVAAGNAAPVATISISATGLAQAAAQAGLSASVLLAAAGAAQGAGNAQLAALLSALATGAAQVSGTANLSGGSPGDLSAAGQMTANAQAMLSVSVVMTAAGAAQASALANGQAGAPGQLSASGQAYADGWAAQSVLVNLTAAGFVHAMAQGLLSVEVPLAAHGVASATGLAQISATGPLLGVRLVAGKPCLLTKAVSSVVAATTFLHGAEHV